MTYKRDLGLPVTSRLDLSRMFYGEKLLRLHPHWYLEACSEKGGMTRARLRDHATEAVFSISFSLSFPDRTSMVLDFENGPFEQISIHPEGGVFRVAATGPGGELSAGDEESLELWLHSFHHYLRLYLRNTPNRLLFRFLLNQVLLKMNPSQRKISLMIIRFTLLEIVVILIIVIGYILFAR